MACRILVHLVDDGGVAEGVIDVSVFDAMSSSRRQHFHTDESYYETWRYVDSDAEHAHR
jgi:hypothetical protein